SSRRNIQSIGSIFAQAVLVPGDAGTNIFSYVGRSAKAAKQEFEQQFVAQLQNFSWLRLPGPQSRQSLGCDGIYLAIWPPFLLLALHLYPTKIFHAPQLFIDLAMRRSPHWSQCMVKHVLNIIARHWPPIGQ